MLALMGSRTPKTNDQGKRDAGGVLLEESVAAQPLGLPALFGNDRPVELEIGTGKGAFLLARAAARPEINFLGLEWARPYCRYAADRFRRAGLANVRMLRTDAGPFVKSCLPGGSLWRVHIYFPDPWPKSKHHRRRLIQKSFIQQIVRVLKPGGQALIVTDHLDYFRHIQKVMRDVPSLCVVPFPGMTDQEGQVVGTNFERKYIAQGRPFYKLARMKYV